MKNIHPRFASFKLVTRIMVILTAAGIIAGIFGSTAYMQKVANPKQTPTAPAPATAPDALMERVSTMRPGAEAERKASVSADAGNIPNDAAATVSSKGVPRVGEATGNYSFATATNASLTDMSSGTTQLLAANIDDTASALTNIGFDFYFQGARFAQFSINENGVLRLGATAQAGSPYKPLAQAGLSIITAYGADQRTHAGDGKVHFKVIGSAPNRTLVIEWLNNQANFNTGGTADLTYQVRLSETTGVIEFVYGSMTMSAAGAASTDSRDPNIGFSSSNVANTVGSVTAPQSGTPAPTFNGASATPVANLYTAGPITVLTSAAQGSRRSFTFTPPVPNAPTGLNFTGVTQIAMTLNWTDSADETIYAVYRSTDGVNFAFDGTAAQNATSYNATGLAPGTNYFWQVFAVSEGALSTALTGSQATAPPGNISSTAAGGNWSAAATWVGGVVPTATDNVTIVDGSTVTIDVTTATCLNLTVGQGTSGVLQYISTPASTLTVNGNVTVATGGTFTAGAGSLTTHVLNIGGNTSGSTSTGSLTDNGTFDMNTTAGVTTNFFGSSDGTVSGTSATCDFFAIVMQKGTSITPVLDVTRVITINAPAASANRLSATNGTFRLSSASVLTPWFGSQTLTAATGRLWLNNAGASTNVVGVGTGTGAGAPTINGTLRVDAGTFGYGSGNNTMTIGAAGTLIIGGASATVNQFGAVSFTSGATFTMTAGNFNVDPQASNSLAATTNIVRFNSVNVAFTGGTLTIVDPHAATGTGVALSISTSNAATFNFTGGTISFGNGVSNTAGSVDGFDLDTFVGNVLVPIGNVLVNNTATNAATRFVRAANALAPFTQLYGGNLTVTNTGGSEFRLNGHLVGVSGNIINNGTINGTVAASRLYFLGNGVAQTYSGTGTIVSPLVQMDVDNPLGVTIDPSVSQIILGTRINFFRGTLTNSNKITFGTGAAAAFDLQYGVAGGVTPGGNLDQAPVFNLGTGIYTVTYAQESVGRTTSFEIPASRTVNVISVNNTNNVTLAGGNLTLSSAATAATFTNGRFITNANTLILSSGAATVARTNGYVDGNFRKTYSAAASKSFEVGTANGFSPVTVNATAGTFPGDFTVKAIQGQMPQISGTNALQRYWTLSNNITGNVANMTFNYLATDVVGTAASYVFVKNNGGTLTNIPPAAPPTTTQASVNSVSAFSDWTLAEPNAVQPGNFQFSSATYTDNETNSDHTFNAVVNRVGGSDGNVSVDFQVTDGTATVAGGDYTVASPTGTLNWNSGDATPRNVTITVKGDVSFEPDETVNFQLNNPQGGPVLGTPSSAVLTITNDDAPVSTGQIIISEFRLRGPDPDGAGSLTGALDEYVELYNNTNSPHTVGATDASAGYGVVASDGVLRCTIPNGVIIPARGHFLCVNSAGYSLGNYPAGNAPLVGHAPVAKGRPRSSSSRPGPSPSDDATLLNVPNALGDATYTTDIPDNMGIALFTSTTTFNAANRLDAVGSTSEANTLYKEGTGYPALTPFDIEYAFLRDTCGKGGAISAFGPCTAGGLPVDTDNNAADFYFVDTNGTSAGAGQRLGAPGPENLSSPIQRNANFAVASLDATVGTSDPPNRVRDFSSSPANSSTSGTLSLRKRVVNNTGASVTRLRFRIVDYTTFPAPSGVADLRARTSTLVVVSGVNDAATCLASNGVATTPCTVNVEGTTIEEPPNQNPPGTGRNGGGFNSTLSAGTVTLSTPLANGASVNLQFLLGIQQTGRFRFFINVEALP
jgi:hypothetical protein